MLAEEELGRVLVGGGQQALRRPPRRAAVGPARLLEHGVERVAREAERRLDVVAEGGRVGGLLEDVVQPLGAVAHAQHVAELLQAPRGQPVARGQADVLGLQTPAQREHALAVVGVALVVAPAALERAGVGRAVDVVDARPDRGQAAGHERLAHALGRHRQVAHDAQPAEALAEQAPVLDAQLAADVLGVADDRVGAVVHEALGLLAPGQPGQRADRARAPGAPLVEHEDAELVQGAVQPPRGARVAGRTRRLAAGPALQEDEHRAVASVGVGDLAREDGDPLAVRRRVVERDRELVLGQQQAAGCEGGGHA